MKSDIILLGVGGQGILSIASIIGLAAIENDLCLKQAEVHGMSQRGGDVQSHLRLSSHPVHSDLIPYGKADLIISVEPMESLRYLPWLSASGWLVTNSTPFVNIDDYPPVEDILSRIRKLENHKIVDADEIARQIGSARSGNVVILGAASHYLDLPWKSLEKAVVTLFSKKSPELADLNLKALRAGRNA